MLRSIRNFDYAGKLYSIPQTVVFTFPANLNISRKTSRFTLLQRLNSHCNRILGEVEPRSSPSTTAMNTNNRNPGDVPRYDCLISQNHMKMKNQEGLGASTKFPQKAMNSLQTVTFLLYPCTPLMKQIQYEVRGTSPWWRQTSY